MGGKTLKFPRRKKYMSSTKENNGAIEEKPISEEEHKKRVQILREIGLLKE